METLSINCTGDESETCACPGCVKARADFDAWVADTEKRWAKAYAEGRVAHLCGNPCANPLCPKAATVDVWCGMAEVAS